MSLHPEAVCSWAGPRVTGWQDANLGDGLRHLQEKHPRQCARSRSDWPHDLSSGREVDIEGASPAPGRRLQAALFEKLPLPMFAHVALVGVRQFLQSVRWWIVLHPPPPTGRCTNRPTPSFARFARLSAISVSRHLRSHGVLSRSGGLHAAPASPRRGVALEDCVHYVDCARRHVLRAPRLFEQVD